MRDKENTLLQRMICSWRGHRYPIKWRKERLPNGEVAQVGMGDTNQPCNRCGVLKKGVIADLERMFWNIADDLKQIKDKLDL